MNSRTMSYIVKRLLLALLTVFFVVTVTFWAMRAIPGGPFTQEKVVDPATEEELKRLYGLDKPLFTQYLLYLGNAFIWNFGFSLKSEGAVTVLSMIGEGLKYSAIIGLLAAALAIVVGVTLGSIAALKHNRVVDRIIMIGSTASVAMPSFVIATLLFWIFCKLLNWFPTDYQNPAGFILPIITVSLSPACYITRLTRSATLDVLGADYIRTAQAKGVSKNKVLFKHALRNSLTPVITYAGPMIAYVITGSIIVERIFAIPGLGGTFVDCITQRDYSVIMGTTVFLTYLMVIMVLLSDILYKIVNPRVEFE